MPHVSLQLSDYTCAETRYQQHTLTVKERRLLRGRKIWGKTSVNLMI